MGQGNRNRHRGRRGRDGGGSPARPDKPIPATPADANARTFENAAGVLADARDRRRRNAADIKAARPVVTKWTLLLVLALSAPLWAAYLLQSLIPEGEQQRYALITVVAAVMITFQSISAAMYRAAVAHVAGDSAAANFRGRPHRFMMSELRDEILRASDFTGRWTVACLLWAVFYWGAVQLLSGESVSLPALKRDYIDIALLAGPLIGVIWWTGDVAIREGAEYHRRQLERARTPLARTLLGRGYNLVIYRSFTFFVRLAFFVWVAAKIVG